LKVQTLDFPTQTPWRLQMSAWIMWWLYVGLICLLTLLAFASLTALIAAPSLLLIGSMLLG